MTPCRQAEHRPSRYLASAVAIALIGFLASTPSRAAGVIVNGLEWRQLTETTGFSWNQIATVCSPTTGACTGSIGSVNFAGWTWATNPQIQALFDALIKPGTTEFPSFVSQYFAVADPDIDAAIGPGAFAPTFADPFRQSIAGISRTTFNTSLGTFALAPYMQDNLNVLSADAAELGPALPVSSTILGPLLVPGVWLYQPTAVPLPAAGWLMMSGLAVLVTGLRRRRVSAAR